MSDKLEDLPLWAQELVINTAPECLKNNQNTQWQFTSDDVIKFTVRKDGFTFQYWARKGFSYIY